MQTAKLLKNMGLDFEWRIYGWTNSDLAEHIVEEKAENLNIRQMGIGSAEDLKKAQVGNISRACQGKINTHKGYKWKYITSEELFEFEKKILK